MSAEPRLARQFYRYQQRWIRDDARFLIGMQARQTGKSDATSYKIVRSVMAAEAAGKAEQWIILSRGERQALEVMRTHVRRYARAYQMALDIVQGEFCGSDETRYRSFEVEWPGGSRVLALPANADTARGFSAHVWLDEFAFHQDSREIWKALYPVTTRGYQVIVTSTPNGPCNKFYELMTGDGPWVKHQTDIYQAVADGMPVDIAELRAGLADEEAWAQEYELQWADDSSSWLDADLITACEHTHAGDTERYADGPCFIGVDIATGRGRDRWVLTVLERVGDVLWMREQIASAHLSIPDQDALLVQTAQRYRTSAVWMDQTGLGEGPVAYAKQALGEHRVHGVMFNGASKLHLATALKREMQDRRVRLTIDDELRRDLRKVRKVQGPTGNVRFDADADRDGHADRFWSLALAATAACDAPDVRIEYASVGRRVETGLLSQARQMINRGWGAIAGRNDFRGYR